MNKPKAIGTACETAVVRYARAHGFGVAERLALHGNADEGDILLCPTVIVEVKGGHAAETASDAQIHGWLLETEVERRNRGAGFAFLVTKRKGYGATRAGQWWAHMRLGWIHDELYEHAGPETYGIAVRMTLEDALHILRVCGHGDPL